MYLESWPEWQIWVLRAMGLGILGLIVWGMIKVKARIKQLDEKEGDQDGE